MDDVPIYEWDEAKRQATLKDRGIDFASMVFFDWDSARTIEDTRNDYGETRYVSIGFIANRLHVCIWCQRDDAVRIISLRKANRDEREDYV